MNIHKLSAALLAGAAGSALLLSASPAGAVATRPHTHTSGHEATKSAPAAPKLPATLPPGYTVATTSFLSYAEAQDAAEVHCPGTEQPAGGGAFVTSSDLLVNLNRSYPWRRNWIVSVGNATASPTPVTAYVICMAHSASYQIVHSAPASVGRLRQPGRLAHHEQFRPGWPRVAELREQRREPCQGAWRRRHLRRNLNPIRPVRRAAPTRRRPPSRAATARGPIAVTRHCLHGYRYSVLVDMAVRREQNWSLFTCSCTSID